MYRGRGVGSQKSEDRSQRQEAGGYPSDCFMTILRHRQNGIHIYSLFIDTLSDRSIQAPAAASQPSLRTISDNRFNPSFRCPGCPPYPIRMWRSKRKWSPGTIKTPFVFRSLLASWVEFIFIE